MMSEKRDDNFNEIQSMITGIKMGIMRNIKSIIKEEKRFSENTKKLIKQISKIKDEFIYAIAKFHQKHDELKIKIFECDNSSFEEIMEINSRFCIINKDYEFFQKISKNKLINAVIKEIDTIRQQSKILKLEFTKENNSSDEIINNTCLYSNYNSKVHNSGILNLKYPIQDCGKLNNKHSIIHNSKKTKNGVPNIQFSAKYENDNINLEKRNSVNISNTVITTKDNIFCESHSDMNKKAITNYDNKEILNLIEIEEKITGENIYNKMENNFEESSAKNFLKNNDKNNTDIINLTSQNEITKFLKLKRYSNGNENDGNKFKNRSHNIICDLKYFNQNILESINRVILKFPQIKSISQNLNFLYKRISNIFQFDLVNLNLIEKELILFSHKNTNELIILIEIQSLSQSTRSSLLQSMFDFFVKRYTTNTENSIIIGGKSKVDILSLFNYFKKESFLNEYEIVKVIFNIYYIIEDLSEDIFLKYNSNENIVLHNFYKNEVESIKKNQRLINQARQVFLEFNN